MNLNTRTKGTMGDLKDTFRDEQEVNNNTYEYLERLSKEDKLAFLKNANRAKRRRGKDNCKMLFIQK